MVVNFDEDSGWLTGLTNLLPFRIRGYLSHQLVWPTLASASDAVGSPAESGLHTSGTLLFLIE